MEMIQMHDSDAVDSRSEGSGNLSSCVESKKKSMKLKDLIGYFGALKDSEILDDMKAEILRMREL
jgi:hypothetical protein